MSELAEQAVCFAAEQVANRFCELASSIDRPSVIFRPKLSMDGNKWIALYGDNLQVGVVGVGESPGEAMYHFDLAWGKRVTEQHRHVGPDRSCAKCGNDLTHPTHERAGDGR